MKTGMGSASILVLFILSLSTSSQLDFLPIYPDWGRMAGQWKTPIPGEGWSKAGDAVKIKPEAGAFHHGFRVSELKYLRERDDGPSNQGKDAFSLAAAPGQYASFSFRLESETQRKGLRIGISPFMAKQGGKGIGAEMCDIRVVRPLVKRIYQTRTYATIPTLLDKIDTLDLDPRQPVDFWVTLYFPPESSPGIFSGRISLSAGTVKAWSSQISLTVWPIRLEEPTRVYQLYYSLSKLDPIYPTTVPQEMRDIKAHGINSLAFLATPELVRKDGKAIVDFSRSIAGEALGLDSLISCYKTAGFTLPINYSFCLNQLWHNPEGGWREVSKNKKEFRAGLKTLFAEASSRIRSGDWPVLNFGLDEPSPRLDEAVEFLEWIREDYAYPSLVNCHGAIQGIDDISRLSPLVGIVSVTRTVPGMAQSMVKVRAAGRKFWICNGGGFGSNPALDRYFFGLDAWRLGADGVSQWNYHQGNDEFWTPDKPYGKSKGDYPTFAFGYPSPTGPIPSIGWEAVREGIDDGKFLVTLERLLDRPVVSDSSGGENQAVAIGRKYLDSLKASLPIENADRLRYLAGKQDNFMDGVRRRVAELILAVKKTAD